MEYLIRIIEAVTPVLSIAIAVFAGCVAYAKFSSERKRSAIFENVKVVIQIYDSFLEDPELLRCIGTSKEEIEKCGVSLNQFVFLLKDFTAGMIYYEINSKKFRKTFPAGSKRYKMCQSQPLRRAWPHMRQLFISHEIGLMTESTLASLEKLNLQATKEGGVKAVTGHDDQPL